MPQCPSCLPWLCKQYYDAMAHALFALSVHRIPACLPSLGAILVHVGMGPVSSTAIYSQSSIIFLVFGSVSMPE